MLERLIKKLSAEIEKLEKKSTALQEELWQGLKKRLPEKYDLQRIVLSQIAEFKKANLDPCLEQIIKNYKNNDFNDKVTSIFEKLKEALAQKFVSKLNFKNQIYEFTSKHLAPL